MYVENKVLTPILWLICLKLICTIVYGYITQKEKLSLKIRKMDAF